jgi:hypothetical protein
MTFCEIISDITWRRFLVGGWHSHDRKTLLVFAVFEIFSDADLEVEQGSEWAGCPHQRYTQTEFHDILGSLITVSGPALQSIVGIWPSSRREEPRAGNLYPIEVHFLPRDEYLRVPKYRQRQIDGEYRIFAASFLWNEGRGIARWGDSAQPNADCLQLSGFYIQRLMSPPSKTEQY